MSWLRRASPELIARFYLLIAVPVMVLLCFAIAPFGPNDEKQHFLRIVSILEGYTNPEVAFAESVERPHHKVAGGRVGEQVRAIAEEADYGRIAPFPSKKLSLRDLWLSFQRYDVGKKVFIEHSNTAIYPPLLYCASIMSIAVAKEFSLPVLAWVYIGRLTNVLIASLACWYAIRRSESLSPAVLIVSCLPVFLYQSATLSADAALLPYFLLFATLLSRISGGFDLTVTDAIALALVGIFISVGKVAYLPVTMLPSIFLWMRMPKVTGYLTLFSVSSVVSVVTWCAWAYFIHDKVFSMRPDIAVDPVAQIHYLVSHPMTAFSTFAGTVINRAPSLLLDSVGRKLGYSTIKINTLVCYVLLFSSFTISAARSVNNRDGWRFSLVIMVVVAICFIITLVLLYLQFNPVGASFVDGLQGRYLAPLLVFLVIFAPVIRAPASVIAARVPAAMFIALASAFITICVVAERYWSI